MHILRLIDQPEVSIITDCFINFKFWKSTQLHAIFWLKYMLFPVFDSILIFIRCYTCGLSTITLTFAKFELFNINDLHYSNG